MKRVATVIMTIDLVPLILALIYLVNVGMTDWKNWSNFPFAIFSYGAIIVLYSIIAIIIIAGFSPIIIFLFMALKSKRGSEKIHENTTISSVLTVGYALIIYQYGFNLYDKALIIAISAANLLYLVYAAALIIWQNFTFSFASGNQDNSSETKGDDNYLDSR